MRQLPGVPEAGRGVLLPSHGDRSPSAGLHSPQRTPSAGRHWAQGPREGTCPRLLSSRTRACLPGHAPPRPKETFVSALEGRGHGYNSTWRQEGREHGPSAPRQGVRGHRPAKRLPHPTQRARVGTADRLWGWVGSASNPRIPGPGSTAPGVGVLRCGKRQVQKREASSALSLRPTGRSGAGAVPLGTPRLWKGIQPRGPPGPDTGAWGCVIPLLSPGGTSTPSLKLGRSSHLRA